MATFKGVVKQCEVCGKEFKVPQCRTNARACSNACGYVLRGLSNSREKVRLVCEHCGEEFFERDCHAVRRRFCSKTCREASPMYRSEQKDRVSGENNPMWTGAGRTTVSRSGKEYTRSSAAKENAKYKRRQVAKLQAVPAWADKAKVDWFYVEAQRISEFAGMTYHVDHIVPLQSKRVCGLHCEFNLQLLPRADNIRKGNKFWPDMA